MMMVMMVVVVVLVTMMTMIMMIMMAMTLLRYIDTRKKEERGTSKEDNGTPIQ